MTHRVVDAHGSFICVGQPWSVINCRGTLAQRQATANKHGVVCYAECHLNAAATKIVPYSCAIVPSHATPHCLAWAKHAVKLAAAEFGISNGGVITKGRGTGNISSVRAPALLFEPLFISDPANFAANGETIDALGRVLAQSIRDYFSPGMVGLSVGHLYRGNGDTGAPVAHLAGEVIDPEFDTEGELNDAYAKSATEFLLSYR